MTKLVRDVMNTEVTHVSPETSMPDLQRVFLETGYGAVPVLDRWDELKGIVSRSDVVRRFSLEQSLAELADSDFDAILGVEDNDDALESIGSAVGRRMSKLTAGDVMISDVLTIGQDEPLAEAARRMLERRIHRIPVLEGEKLVGMVSAFDFLRLYAQGE